MYKNVYNINMKVNDVLKEGIKILKENELEEPILKARVLLVYILKIKNEELIIHLDDEIDNEKILKYKECVNRLLDGVPLQYITHIQNFYGLNFYVDENVLIPQPDTEILVEEVINIANTIDKEIKILDICTGSGAIAVALAQNIKNTKIYASDISLKALEIAEKNAENNMVNVEFIESDMFESINQKFDIIVSNPPYIESEVIKNLSKEVQNEPHLALDGGEDGLDFYRFLTKKAKDYLNDNGILVVEIGYDQKDKVMKLFEKNDFENIYCKKDYGNNDRIVVGKRRK